MAVKILIKRKIPKGLNNPKFSRLIRQLRALAVVHQGYISGETLKQIDDPQEYLVISTWQNKDAWNAWRMGRERAEIQEQIDTLLGTPTEYEMYEYV
jgi:heme oxygenase (mycobilin-producing)